MEKSPELVFFDVGDVLCSFQPDVRLAAFANATGLAREEIHARLWGSGFSSRCDAGEFAREEMYQAVREKLGKELSDSEIANLWGTAFLPNPEVRKIARGLARSTAVGLLTNNAPVLRDALARLVPDLEHCFEPIVFSSEVGCTKPDPAFFARVQQRVGRAPASLLLIDDSERNVEAARGSGWQAHRFTSGDELRRALLEYEWSSPLED